MKLWMSLCRVQHQRPKTIEVDVHMATYLWFVQLWTFNSSQWCKLWTEVEVLQIRAMHKRVIAALAVEMTSICDT